MIKVVYFTIVQISFADNGGSICCRSHIKSMANDPDIELLVVTAGSENSKKENLPFFESNNIRKKHIVLKLVSTESKQNYFVTNFPMAYEEPAKMYTNTDEEFFEIINTEKPDIIVVDYLPSIFFIKSIFKTSIPRCIITLNREAEFHKNLCLQNSTNQPFFGFKLAQLRWSYIEHKIYKNCHGIIALTENDIPKYKFKKKRTAAIPVLIERSEHQWKYKGNRNLFFVGNMAHYPNREAMQWICTRLAPNIDSESQITINIIGAESEEVPKDWNQPLVNFLGKADRAEVIHQFTHSSLFIAPIANNFGSKIKLLECISFGIPFIATKEALSGTPFLKNIPLIDLSKPREIADQICALLNNQDNLENLSQSIKLQTDQFEKSQTGIWSKVLGDTIKIAAT